MNINEYEYNYHDLAQEADYIEEESTNIVDGLLDEIPEMTESYYDDGTDEPWMDEDDDVDWTDYYHNLTDEISDE
jgi:hypothetical protein